MILVRVVSQQYAGHLAARTWLEDRQVRVIGFGGKRIGANEVTSLPYVVQSLIDGPPDSVGCEYQFSDDLAELAMLFKLTFVV